MGFALSILYFVTYYLTPAYVFGPFGQFHVEMIIVALALMVSLPALMKSFILKNPQSLALFGLAVAVSLSQLFGKHWAGGAVWAFFSFIPNAMAYFLVCLHCNSKRRLQILAFTLFLVCTVDIAHGYSDLRNGVATSGPPVDPGTGDPLSPGATASPYLYGQLNDVGQSTYRVMGLGALNDPNDFGQLIVCVTPLMFLFWRPKKWITNIALVILPVSILVFGVFLTHSRGALVALTAVSILAARRRIGSIPAMIVAGCLFLGAMALQFTGGRSISADAGEDRTDLWGQGLQLFKTHPIFGVGYGHLWEYTNAYLTAHNSIIVCAGELGILGLYFWSLYLFPTMRDALAVSSPRKVNDSEQIVTEEDLNSRERWKVEQLDKDEINRLGRLIFFSLTGFLVAGWFLSRAFVMTLFLLGGMAEAIYEMALQRGMIAPRLRLPPVMRYSAGLACAMILVMYVMVRVLNLTH